VSDKRFKVWTKNMAVHFHFSYPQSSCFFGFALFPCPSTMQ
jgi:hypothetical protein